MHQGIDGKKMGKKLRQQLTKLCVGQLYSFYLVMLAEKILNYKSAQIKAKTITPATIYHIFARDEKDGIIVYI